MATEARELLIKITGANKDALKKLDTTAGKVNAVGRRIGRTAKNVVRMTAKITAGVGALATGALFAGRKILQVGGRVEETANRFRTVFGPAVGEATGFLDDFARKAGLTTQEAQSVMASVGGLAQGLGFATRESEKFSERVLQLAGDLASYHNVPIEETADAITSALAGEREQLKQLDIVLRQTDVDQKALAETGKESAEALTEQEKAAASLKLITEKAGVAVGDLDRTFDSAANRGRRLGRDLRELRDDIAVALMPAVEEAMGFLEENRGALINFISSSLQAATRAITGFMRFAVKTHRTISNTFLGGLFGIEGEAAELANADQRLEKLQDMRELIADRDAAVVGPGLQNFLQGSGIEADSFSEAISKIDAEIERLQQRIDGEGGLTDSFNTWQQEGEELLDWLDQFEAKITGGLAGVGGGTGGPGDGGGGGGGEGDGGGMNLPIPGGPGGARKVMPDMSEVEVPEQGKQDLIGNLTSALDDGIGAVEGFVKSRARGIGESLIMGIMSGSGDMGETLKNFMMSLASKFIMGALTGGLGIFSPSRATKKIGREVVRGMVFGMREEIPGLQKMSARAAVAALPRSPSLSGPSVGDVGSQAGTLEGAFGNGPLVDASQLPEPISPREAARDRQWLQLLLESEKNLRLVRGDQ